VTEIQQAQTPVEAPSIGRDEWVARQEAIQRQGLSGALRRAGDRIPWWAGLAGAAAVGVLIGALVDNQYNLQVGFDTLIYVLLALGLNVVVGWAGLLDLGYVVFLGIGAYTYAWLASNFFDIHWQAEAIVPIAMLGTSLVGLVIGLTSWRLLGDYLAIVTLFVLQMFITFANNGDSLNLPFVGHVNLTNGANGIHPLDSFTLFGWKATSVRDYYFVALGAAVLLIAALYHMNDSRTGRAWRALREDPLAANLLSVPVNRLKLYAFMCGAAIGALSGTIFAAAEDAVFPPDFNLQKLIFIYAMVILGGAGSIPGVVIGAIVLNISDRALTTPEHADYIFYGAIVLALLGSASPRRWGWKWTSTVVVAIVGFGFAVHAIASAVKPSAVNGDLQGTGWLTNLLSHWVLAPTNPYYSARYGYALMIALVVAMTFVGSMWRRVIVVPLVYLAACVWENLLVGDPSTTRLILLGALLVALMNLRPAGLLGTARVEVV
jgi:ABC-type branched-subunit amino acid transport system permease subunit